DRRLGCPPRYNMSTSPTMGRTGFTRRAKLLRAFVIVGVGASYWFEAGLGAQSARAQGTQVQPAQVHPTQVHPTQVQPTQVHPEVRAVPPLSVVLQQTRKRAPQVRLSHAALAVSQTEFVNARRSSLRNPYFELTGQRGTLGTTKDVALSGTLWLPFEATGQRSARLEEAQAYQDIFEANVDLAEASALGDAFATY